MAPEPEDLTGSFVVLWPGRPSHSHRSKFLQSNHHFPPRPARRQDKIEAGRQAASISTVSSVPEQEQPSNRIERGAAGSSALRGRR